jgi:hypothetical protein
MLRRTSHKQVFIFDISSIIKRESKFLRRRIHFFHCQNGKGPNRHVHVIVWPAKHVRAIKPKLSLYFIYICVRIYNHTTQRSLKKYVGGVTKIAAPETHNKQMSTRTAHSSRTSAAYIIVGWRHYQKQTSDEDFEVRSMSRFCHHSNDVTGSC